MKLLNFKHAADHFRETKITSSCPPTFRVLRAHPEGGAPCMTACIAVLLMASIPAATADTLGRLFFTPEQRIHLDYDYARNAPTEGSSSPFITVNGIVQKHGGPRTVWVNGVAQNADNIADRNPTAQGITVPGKSKPVKLKVGDKLLLDQPATAKQDVFAE